MPDVFGSTAVARQLDDCTYCPKMCRFSCPVSEASGREQYTPQAKMDRLNQLRRGHVGWSDKTTEPLYACTGCRQCTTNCMHGNEPGLVLLAGRAAANARSAGHPALAGYPERFRSREQRLVEILRDHVPAERFDDSAPVGFWPGCDAIDKGLGDIDAALRLFDEAGETDVRLVASGQACAGYTLLAAGLIDMFRWQASRVAAALKPYRTVVINCSACVYTMRAQYPAEGVTLSSEILSLAEFLDRLEKRRQEPPPSCNLKSVYYHDPCYLARYAGVTEEPRRVLARVVEVRELPGSRAETECCGGAGLLPKTMPEVPTAWRGRACDKSPHAEAAPLSPRARPAPSCSNAMHRAELRCRIWPPWWPGRPRAPAQGEPAGPLGAGGLCYTSAMSPKVPQLKKQQLDLIDKSLKMVWVVAIGAALVLVAFVLLLARNTPPPLGEVPTSTSESASQ